MGHFYASIKYNKLPYYFVLQYKWSPQDYDLMAKGSLAGHLIECGAQATGGIYTDWDSVSGWENNGQNDN